MEHNEQRTQFIQQLWQRYELLQQWAIDHWPDREHPLSSADFVEARKEILALGDPPGQPRQGAEPEQGGAQYLNVTPAPWP